MPLYTRALAIKMGVCCLCVYNLFMWDSRDIRGLRCAMLELLSATFLRKNISQLKCKYSNILKSVLAVN